MSAWKKRLIALALWVPFALYAANAVSRVLELSAASFPTMPIPDRETAAKLKAITKSKAQSAQAELQAGAGYLSEENGTYKAALTERFSVTENARQFNEEKPKFVGDKEIAKRFNDLFESQSDLKLKRAKLSTWMKIPVPPDAVDHLGNFRETLLKEFEASGPSADEVVEWQLRALHRCAVSFAKPLGEQYENEVKRPVMPLTGSTQLNDHAKALVKMHEEFTNSLQGNAVALNKINLRPLADDMNADFSEWAARRTLLDLFAEEPTAKSTEACKPWFEKVSKLYGEVKDEKTRSLIRLKVQHFCGAYIPVKMALDPKVLLGTDKVETDRTTVKVRYRYKGDVAFKGIDPPLTDDPDDLNEFTKEDPKHVPPKAMFDRFTLDGTLAYVAPTAQSKAAMEYLKIRQDLTTDGFSLATVTRTIGKVGPKNEMVWNQLSRMNGKGEYNVYDRLKFLKEMTEKKNLFP